MGRVLSITADLATANACLETQNRAHAAFLESAKAYDFVAAAAHGEQSLVALEASMDAFMSACRTQQMLESGGA